MDVYINSNWTPLEETDFNNVGFYLFRWKNDTDGSNISLLEITENTNDNRWIIVNGTTERIENLMNDYLIAGPIVFNKKYE